MAPVVDFRYSKPGDHYRLVLTADGDVESFRYERSVAEHYELVRQGDRFVATEHHPEILRRRVRIAGLVTTSLYAAIEQLGESRELAEDFAEIFAWDVDFSRGARRGDEFSILYERLYTRDAAGPRDLRAARARSWRRATPRRPTTTAPSTSSPVEGRGAYYRPDGSRWSASS